VIFNYSNKDNLHHLDLYQTYVHGPIQKDEALFLYSVVKMIRPSTILEFGLQFGLSSYNFALAKDCEAFYFGLDKEEYCVDMARKLCNGMPNCFFIKSDCLDFDFNSLLGRKVDLFFLDCSHNFEKNKTCLYNVISYLSEDGLIVIHDTGYYTIEAFSKAPDEYKKESQGLEKKLRKNKKIPVIEEEQKTVNWFMENHSQYDVLHLHSDKIMRCGMTFFQKRKKLNF
jgi:predicted O-methyltransferase YrrM